MKAALYSSKRIIGSVIVCVGLASALQPFSAHASALGTANSGTSTSGALYRIPKACQYIENEINSLSPGDFPPPNPVKEEMAVLRALIAQLHACELTHGSAR